MMETGKINKTHCGDSFSVLRTFPDNFIDCCITSPPYYGLRDYGHDGQIGLEKSPELYCEKLVELFREVKRVLKPEGTLWLNLGDSYASGKSRYSTKPNTLESKANGEKKYGKTMKGERPDFYYHPIIKDKDLIGIPWTVAFALRADGWWLRQDIIWSKPNPMPESVTDRCTKAHEYIFLLSKSARYYYDAEAIKEDSVDDESYSGRRERNAGTMAKTDAKNYKFNGSIKDGVLKSGQLYEKRNKRSVWSVTTSPFPEAHFATFPPELIVDCIKAGCPIDGIVLDPFNGSGTTRIVAEKLGRNSIGIELNPKYIQIETRRRKKELGMFEKIAS